MNVEEISKELKTLQDELASLHAAEKHVEEKIDGLLNQLHRELNQSEHESAEEEINDLTALLSRFEVEHPRLTDSINRVMVTLGNMGI